MKEFEVEVTARQRTAYRVAAPDVEAARRLATERWQREEPSDLDGFDWFEIETVRATETSGHLRQRQDDELLLRFVRERERLLVRLGSAFLSATPNDAISASQAAVDLGWYTPESRAGEPAADVLRAFGSLERLCAHRQLVCFERPRVRDGERGTIRLYCTPEYLERLSDSLNASASPVAR